MIFPKTPNYTAHLEAGDMKTDFFQTAEGFTEQAAAEEWLKAEAAKHGSPYGWINDRFDCAVYLLDANNLENRETTA